jgi:hypothetical protein
MRRFTLAVTFLLLCSLSLNAAKIKGSTTLKDLQPANTPDKNNKKQMYDFSFANAGNNYVCRTDRDDKLKATDFVVGDTVKFEIDHDKVKFKNASGKEAKCTIVRVEKEDAAAK